MEGKVATIKLKCEKIPKNTKDPSFTVGQQLDAISIKKGEKALWGRKSSEKVSVLFKEPFVSKKQLVMEMDIMKVPISDTQTKEVNYLSLMDLGSSVNIFLQIEKGVQLMLYKNRMLKIGVDDTALQFYIKDIKLPKDVIQSKQKHILKQVIPFDPESTNSSQLFNHNEDEFDITLQTINLAKDKNLSHKFVVPKNAGGKVFTIGNKNDCDWVLPSCQYEVAAQIGYNTKEGWYISQPPAQTTSVGIALKEYNHEQSGKIILSEGLKIDLQDYVFSHQTTVPQ
eukprot:TRINITY_DN9083_c0_g1_i5.p1 TRINITY_DN9083_c0_g1~~TRINITY_DN9083_c0_g1_i5.p1  ORF type:complete len:283 (-),score=55.09 TRINITY_DN9083_c0_g1_i5:121-969(-)